MFKPFVEKLITAARKGDLASRRRVIGDLQDRVMVTHDVDENVVRNKYGELLDGPRVVKKLFDVIAPRYSDRPGGYTRIVALGKHRIGDGGDLCVLQLVGEEDSGPQVSGQYSRRRNKANHRMEVAAKLRKENREAPSVEEASKSTALEPESSGQEGSE